MFYNEASRQEAIKAYNLAAAFHSPEHVSATLEKALKVHGPYTEGFYDQQLAALGKRLKRKGG